MKKDKGTVRVIWREVYMFDLIAGVNRSTGLLSGFTVGRDHSRVLWELGYEDYYTTQKRKREGKSGSIDF